MIRTSLKNIPAPAEQSPLAAGAFKTSSTVRLEGALGVASAPKLSKEDQERSFDAARSIPLDTETAPVWQRFFTDSIEAGRLQRAAYGLEALSCVPNLTAGFFAGEFSRVFDEYQTKIALSGKPPRGADTVPAMLRALAAVKWSPVLQAVWLDTIRGPHDMAGGDPRALEFALASPHIPKSKLVELSREAMTRFTHNDASSVVRAAIFNGIRRGSFGDRREEMLEHAASVPADIADLLAARGPNDPQAVQQILSRRLRMFSTARYSNRNAWAELRNVLVVLSEHGVAKELSAPLHNAFPDVPATAALNVISALEGQEIATTPRGFIRQLKALSGGAVESKDTKAFALTVLKLSGAERPAAFESLVDEIGSWKTKR